MLHPRRLGRGGVRQCPAPGHPVLHDLVRLHSRRGQAVDHVLVVQQATSQTLSLEAIKAVKHPAGGGDAPAVSLVAKGYLTADAPGQTFTLDGVEMAVRPNIGIYTQPISFIGLPVVAVPVRLDAGLPLGVQVIAAPWREDLALRVARQLERDGICTAPVAELG